MLDQLRQVAIFAKTIDHGSFRGAAKELDLSPSVVSHHISQLEEHLGVALLYRSTRKLALTREGEQLLLSTQPMLEAVQGVFTELSSTASDPTGELRMTAPAVLSQSPFIDMLAAFSIRHSGIKLVLEFTDERQDLITGGHDIAIRAGMEKQGSAVTKNLFTIPRRLIASADYVKSRTRATRPEALNDWSWIELSPVRHIKPTFRKPRNKPVTLKPAGRIVANDAQAAYRLARCGAGVAVLPEFLAKDDVASGVVEYVLPQWQLDPINVYAAWPANAPKFGLIKLFISEVTAGGNWKNSVSVL